MYLDAAAISSSTCLYPVFFWLTPTLQILFTPSPHPQATGPCRVPPPPRQPCMTSRAVQTWRSRTGWQAVPRSAPAAREVCRTCRLVFVVRCCAAMSHDPHTRDPFLPPAPSTLRKYWWLLLAALSSQPVTASRLVAGVPPSVCLSELVFLS